MKTMSNFDHGLDHVLAWCIGFTYKYGLLVLNCYDRLKVDINVKISRLLCLFSKINVP